MPERSTLVLRARFFHWLRAAALLAAALFLLTNFWIPIKAEVAQVLLERAWHKTEDGGRSVPPWPWADTEPVAVLTVPRLDIRQIVLSGSSGRNLAFGPALLMSESSGRSEVILPTDIIINGHRDTHFSFLGEIQKGDKIIIQSVTGQYTFQVSHLEVIDSLSHELVFDPAVARLSLVTCYPLNSLFAGGSLRYVVTALPI